MKTSKSARIILFSSLAVFAALAGAAAQNLDWNRDPLPQIKGGLSAAVSAKTAFPAPSPRALPAPGRIDPVLLAGSGFAPSEPAAGHYIEFGFDYINPRRPLLKAVYTDIAYSGKTETSSNMIFGFPQLKIDMARRLVTYKGRTVALLREDAGTQSFYAVPTNGYLLLHRQVPLGSSYREEVWLGRKPAGGVDYYSGTLTFGGKTRKVCFGVSRKRLNPYDESSTHIPAGVPDYHPIYPFQELGAALVRPEFIDECASAEINGSITSCSGLVLDGAPAQLEGKLSVWLNYYDSLVERAVGRYKIRKTSGCDPNFLLDNTGD
ncbi:MAG: hypothetical protein KGL04_02780 [Elusimicrobia bacterium]|nr:hypothetical protein [Elusimicrobiota bacterium]